MWWLASTSLGFTILGLSLRYNWWRPKIFSTPILMYHQITNEYKKKSLAKLQITPYHFAHQLDFIQKKGYKSITLSEAITTKNKTKSVVITFDDGYANFYSNAWPLLKARKMTATVFLVTGALDKTNSWDLNKGFTEKKIMTKEQILELSKANIEFGGHSHSHLNLTSLDKKKLWHEVNTCQNVLNNLLNKTSKVFSYPYGLYNIEVAKAVKQAGFSAACTTKPGMFSINDDLLTIPRIIIKRSDNIFDFHLKITRCRSHI